MAGTKITGAVTSTVTLGSAATPAPLTITASGSIRPNIYGATGIELAFGAPGVSKIVNAGFVYGAYGAYESASGQNGGFGIQAYSAVNLNNSEVIVGGGGGSAGFYGGQGGSGGYGVDVVSKTASTIANSNEISGGNGGYGGSFGGNGGDGLFSSGALNTVSNSDGIVGGQGGGGGGDDQGHVAGSGGDGVSMSGGTIYNSGGIFGGYGGSNYGQDAGGIGGCGAALSGGAVLTNTGMIIGGTGGTSAYQFGGSGNSGVIIHGGTLINAGTITGGAAGMGAVGYGRAGDAVFIYGTAAGTVVAQDGAVFNGAVVASTAGTDTLEVAGTSGAVLSGIGTQFTNFGELEFATGAVRGIAGNVAGIAGGEKIVGFAAGDSIIFAGIAYAKGDSVAVKKNGKVTVTLDGTKEILDIAGAKKGEKDFKLAGAALGVTLTRAAPKMAFVIPPASHAGGTEALWHQPAPSPAVAPTPWVVSATIAPAPLSLLEKPATPHFPAVTSAGHGF